MLLYFLMAIISNVTIFDVGIMLEHVHARSQVHVESWLMRETVRIFDGFIKRVQLVDSIAWWRAILQCCVSIRVCLSSRCRRVRLVTASIFSSLSVRCRCCLVAVAVAVVAVPYILVLWFRVSRTGYCLLPDVTYSPHCTRDIDIFGSTFWQYSLLASAQPL